ncbi:DUF2196 domain-containing protein [Deinococcus petrolearius]|uniref:DUF2196 domain-containing protein n=1 Tax=Deinococcus petrolearius TaxID=1751295 RepID=A0ABW1DI24_9DEIO
MPPLRSHIQPGLTVDIVQKQDQPTGRLIWPPIESLTK